MTLRNYSIRLDEEEYEKLKKHLSESGDPDVNVGYVVRQYIRDLNRVLPDLKKSEFGLSFNLAFFGSMFRQLVRSAQLELLVKGDKVFAEKVQKRTNTGDK